MALINQIEVGFESYVIYLYQRDWEVNSGKSIWYMCFNFDQTEMYGGKTLGDAIANGKQHVTDYLMMEGYEHPCPDFSWQKYEEEF